MHRYGVYRLRCISAARTVKHRALTRAFLLDWIPACAGNAELKLRFQI